MVSFFTSFRFHNFWLPIFKIFVGKIVRSRPARPFRRAVEWPGKGRGGTGGREGGRVIGVRFNSNEPRNCFTQSAIICLKILPRIPRTVRRLIWYEYYSMCIAERVWLRADRTIIDGAALSPRVIKCDRTDARAYITRENARTASLCKCARNDRQGVCFTIRRAIKSLMFLDR